MSVAPNLCCEETKNQGTYTRVTDQWTGSNLEKEYSKARHCHPAYLTHMQSPPCEMLGWMIHKLESSLPGEIVTISDMQMVPLEWQGERGE